MRRLLFIDCKKRMGYTRERGGLPQARGVLNQVLCRVSWLLIVHMHHELYVYTYACMHACAHMQVSEISLFFVARAQHLKLIRRHHYLMAVATTIILMVASPLVIKGLQAIHGGAVFGAGGSGSSSSPPASVAGGNGSGSGSGSGGGGSGGGDGGGVLPSGGKGESTLPLLSERGGVVGEGGGSGGGGTGGRRGVRKRG